VAYLAMQRPLTATTTKRKGEQWDFSTEDVPWPGHGADFSCRAGVRLSGTLRGSPVEQAGLRSGRCRRAGECHDPARDLSSLLKD
jgi:hypothetical protein